VQLLPILTQLGVPADKIREEIIRKFQLPDNFNVVVAPTPTKPVGVNAVPDEASLSTGATEQVSDPQALADSLTRFNQ
jgi:sugar (pentulose or hexulose) kinase